MQGESEGDLLVISGTKPYWMNWDGKVLGIVLPMLPSIEFDIRGDGVCLMISGFNI